MPTATKKTKTETAVKAAAPKAPASAKVAPAKKEEGVSRIRIKIRAYDSRIIDQATKTIVETAERNEAKVVGPVPLPTEKMKFTVNRSTFVHKNAREQFEMRVHKRLVDIMNASPKAIDALMSLHLPAGVDIEIKM
jgi:small subunit ribosomal protein S10